MSKVSDRELPTVKELLRQWDSTTNPVFLSAAGQLRQALRKDGLNRTAEAEVRS